jgi:hypothetical protein
MAKPKFKRSVFFTDRAGDVRFLFQVLNLGQQQDELKFIFNHPDSGTGGIYVEARGRFTGEEIIRLQPEISYHADGSLLQKMPRYSPRAETVYKNPDAIGLRRTPLAEIFAWERVVKYTVVDYSLCKKPLKGGDEIVPYHSGLFDGTPFECILFLGRSSMPSPRVLPERAVLRLPGVAAGLDLLCCFYKSTYQGEHNFLPSGSARVFSRLNVIEIFDTSS